MCRTVRQTNHSCGHQVTTSMGKAKFCLFYPHKAEDFHAVTTVYASATNNHPCYECKVKMDAFANGLKGADKHQYVTKRYAESREASSKKLAKEHIAAANKSQKNSELLTPEKIAQLNENAREQVKYYLHGKRAQGKVERTILLKTIIQMPDVIDRKGLVKLFGSHVVWDWRDRENAVWKGLPSGDRAALMSIARRAGLSKTLEEGFKEQRPIEVKAVNAAKAK
ncbi:uncharacterized protein F4807DRAFT_27251 [Annulohypoxylon truncatum]|uniref:uncharacterized protein n=1 Tax=Annulohypoxylon truncatum TaxID=327061 RepID=UPI0020074D20|nr:uncharacterized protein F4807DRAFT_27251 [Annulohypoxylon truncatum]KAI1211157.1 hypothetical protein F4807DRAFT_27251 [Annulohypoxylon truncatum]